MTDATQIAARSPASLLWTLLARSFGLAAGIAGALLGVAALLRAT
jgi:hypothetical protein